MMTKAISLSPNRMWSECDRFGGYIYYRYYKSYW